MSFDRRHIVVGVNDKRDVSRSQELEYFPAAAVSQLRIHDRDCRRMRGKPSRRVCAVSADVDVGESGLAKTVFDFVRDEEVVLQEENAGVVFHGVADRAISARRLGLDILLIAI